MASRGVRMTDRSAIDDDRPAIESIDAKHGACHLSPAGTDQSGDAEGPRRAALQD
jgi:hypothetical protein